MSPIQVQKSVCYTRFWMQWLSRRLFLVCRLAEQPKCTDSIQEYTRNNRQRLKFKRFKQLKWGKTGNCSSDSTKRVRGKGNAPKQEILRQIEEIFIWGYRVLGTLLNHGKYPSSIQSKERYDASVGKFRGEKLRDCQHIQAPMYAYIFDDGKGVKIYRPFSKYNTPIF